MRITKTEEEIYTCRCFKKGWNMGIVIPWILLMSFVPTSLLLITTIITASKIDQPLVSDINIQIALPII